MENLRLTKGYRQLSITNTWLSKAVVILMIRSTKTDESLHYALYREEAQQVIDQLTQWIEENK